MNKFKADDMVLVTWLDAQNISVRITDDDLDNYALAENTNLGYVLRCDKEKMLLAHGHSSTTENDCFVLHTPAIKSVKRMTTGEMVPVESLFGIRRGGNGEVASSVEAKAATKPGDGVHRRRNKKDSKAKRAGRRDR